MCRRTEAILVILLLCLAQLAGAAVAQTEPASEDAVERYLAERGLTDLLAARLQQRLDTTLGEERIAIAERLGSLYVRLLTDAATPQQRERAEALSRELLRKVPESESFELRINLAKASYLKGEELAELHRLRIAGPEERSEAERVLRSTLPIFESVGSNVHRRVESLERREQRGSDPDPQSVKEQLADARRLRSLAMYYTGWSRYYLALVSGDVRLAEQAKRDFGWILNAPGNREPTVERLPAPLLRFEHVARAAMGVALAASLRGNDVEAVRWLDMLVESPEVPESVRRQLFTRRIAILGAARRWADLDLMISRARRAVEGKEALLETADARLLAVVVLEALDDPKTRGVAGRDRLLETLAQTALGDLVSRGEVGHVIDLVSRYGTAPIGNEGFIVQFVRGLRAYERAREYHARTGEDGEAPTADEAATNRYREAARALLLGVDAEDAGVFPKERARAALLRGLSLYYAGEPEAAADAYEIAASLAPSEDDRQEALWYAIVALDRAVEGGRLSLVPRRDRLAGVFLQSFPRTERAARLLLRRVEGGLLDDAEAIEVLLAVPRESALYDVARRHATRLLYTQCRIARPADRGAMAARFASVAEELIERDRWTVMNGTPVEAGEAADFVVLRVRQMLDVLMSATAPDVRRAERALSTLEEVRAYLGMNLDSLEEEIEYRKLQIALVHRDRPKIDAASRRLQEIGGRFAEAADRLVYRVAIEQRRANPEDVYAAREVVRYGSRILAGFEPLESSVSNQQVSSLVEAIADAADALWRLERDEAARDAALRLDARLIDLGKHTARSLRRYSRLSEEAGDPEGALDGWRTLLAGLAQGSDEWFEARYESLRLLAALDAPRARIVLDQHKTLFPQFGPEPWGAKLRELDAALQTIPAPSPDGGGTP
ncbi:MAG: hypothetical protein KIS87_02650 [Phycisphaeraceae bacterium]|nr:hypothetical protein [Phycisphaeraceae bacterium]